jgi:hypothetical protein
LQRDVPIIRDSIAELVSNGKEVVLVVHSYAGFPGGEARKGLGKKERADDFVDRAGYKSKYRILLI